jgi:hypothetical protein
VSVVRVFRTKCIPAGLIAQDVQAKYPDAVIEDANGYLAIDLPVLADQDEFIAKMVMEGDGDVVGLGFCIARLCF